jgi:hypothetical protein
MWDTNFTIKKQYEKSLFALVLSFFSSSAIRKTDLLESSILQNVFLFFRIVKIGRVRNWKVFYNEVQNFVFKILSFLKPYEK